MLRLFALFGDHTSESNRHCSPSLWMYSTRNKVFKELKQKLAIHNPDISDADQASESSRASSYQPEASTSAVQGHAVEGVREEKEKIQNHISAQAGSAVPEDSNQISEQAQSTNVSRSGRPVRRTANRKSSLRFKEISSSSPEPVTSEPAVQRLAARKLSERSVAVTSSTFASAPVAPSPVSPIVSVGHYPQSASSFPMQWQQRLPNTPSFLESPLPPMSSFSQVMPIATSSSPFFFNSTGPMVNTPLMLNPTPIQDFNYVDWSQVTAQQQQRFQPFSPHPNQIPYSTSLSTPLQSATTPMLMTPLPATPSFHFNSLLSNQSPFLANGQQWSQNYMPPQLPQQQQPMQIQPPQTTPGAMLPPAAAAPQHQEPKQPSQPVFRQSENEWLTLPVPGMPENWDFDDLNDISFQN
ncbi:UNVERIFIED_CONTAM: hypothetical protein HDU68_009257 [Siphonaria sp. JEL0065]|nr:hypothetical protein HDU68_009257 [Siphonaria sp. JEL0065]